jgi:hypothetical protein
LNATIPGEMSPDPTPDSRRSRVRRIALMLAVLAAGVLLALLADGVMAIVGAGLIGVAVVLAMANVFYEIGRSEDRERARPSARRERPEPSPNGRAADAPDAGRLTPPRDWPPGGRRGRHD